MVAPNRRSATVVLCAVTSALLAAAPARADTNPPAGWWTWPITGPVVRGFEPPATPFSPGHRGIDIGAPFGTPVHAPADGVVAFAGWVAGSLFVTIDHGDGYLSTDSWLAQALVREGQSVYRGDVVGLSGRGHPELPDPQLHFGVRLHGLYIDPLLVLQRRSVVDLIRLAPLDERTAGDSGVPPAVSGPAFPAPMVAAALLLRDRLAVGLGAFPAARGWAPARGPPA